MIEKFFDLERVLISFIVTIVITVMFVIFAIVLKLKVEDVTLYIVSGVLFILVKLFFANLDLLRENKDK